MSQKSGNFHPGRAQQAAASRMNPIRSLTASSLLASLEAWRHGDLRRLVLLWEEMEQRDWVLCSVVSKRKKAVARCNWTILAVDDSEEARQQAAFLRDFYNGLEASHAVERDAAGGVRLLLHQMMDSVGKRFAVHEIIWKPKPGMLTAELLFCPLWFFENRTGKLRFLQTDSALEGIGLADGEWIVTAGDGIMLASAIAYVAKDLGFKDWLNVSEKFGMPIVDAETDSRPGSAEWESLVAMVGDIGRDWAVIHNRGSKLQLLEASTGDIPQPKLVEYIDRALASLWRGADLSTLSAGTGTGTGASIQREESQLLLDDDCAQLSETLNFRLDLPALRWRFGETVVPLAYFKVFPPPRPFDEVELRIDDFLIRCGVPVAAADVLQRYNRTPSNRRATDIIRPRKRHPRDAHADRESAPKANSR